VSAAVRPRLGALDLLRGLTVAAMILVNNPGNWNRVYPPLTHAAWHGATVADFIFPAFIVIMGVAMAFVLRSPTDGAERRRIDTAIVRRAAVLVALGLVLNVAAAWPHPLAARIPGVLQRLGVTYLVAALIVVRTTPRQQGLLAAVLLAAHWVVLLLGGSLAPGANLSARLDHWLFGTPLLNAAGDPEGALGTVSCVATTLLGVCMGHWIRRQLAAEHGAVTVMGGVAATGLAAGLTGLLWSVWLPLNKALWTSSFAVLTTGAALLGLAVCLAIERTPLQRLLAPFLWLGVNPLAIYFLSELTARAVQYPWGLAMAPRDALFWNVLVPLVGDHGEPRSSLVYAVAYLFLWTAVAGLLRWKGVRVRV
jgi:predicted acyltransferase